MQLHDISTAARLVHWPQMIPINTFLVWHLSFRAAHIIVILWPTVHAYITSFQRVNRSEVEENNNNLQYNTEVDLTTSDSLPSKHNEYVYL